MIVIRAEVDSQSGTEDGAKAAIGEPWVAERDGDIHLDVVTPVRDGEGSAVAVVLLRVDPGPMRALYDRTLGSRDPTKDVTLIRRDGDQVRYLNPMTASDLDDTHAVVVPGGPPLENVVRDMSDRIEAEQATRRRLEELRRWRAGTFGREERILTLKAEVNTLLEAAGESPRYGSVLEGAPDHAG